jgi:hypothetical protein
VDHPARLAATASSKMARSESKSSNETPPAS